MNRTSALLLTLFILLITNTANALPRLDAPVPLPAEFDAIITIYPDNYNTASQQQYWLIPSTARIVRTPNKNLAFGLVHSGVSGFDPDGVNALLNVTIQPYIDAKTLQKAKDLIKAQAGNATVSFSYVVPRQMTCRMLIGGQFHDFGGDKMTVVNGGSVEAGIPFQFKFNNSFDVRCFAQAGGDKAALFGALYTMKFQGVGNRVKFTVTAKFKETMQHFKAAVAGSAWYGAIKADTRTEWTNLKHSGAVTLKVWEGTEEQVDKWGAKLIVDGLLKQLTDRTGMFARTLKPTDLPDAPGGGGALGWLDAHYN
jgi:hypothetical protein